MDVKKAIRKIVALGTGAAMIGATIMGASAYTLADYPSPFVQNGAFSGKIVIGASASTADVLGAVDISASLQAAAKTGVSVAGASATTTVSNGVLIEDSNNQDLNYEDTWSTKTFKKADFPVLLADGIVLDESASTEQDYDQSIAIASKSMAYTLVDNDVYGEPILYLDLDGNTNPLLTFKVDFDSGDYLDIPNLADSESIKMFGSTFTFKNVADTDDIILYGSKVTQLVTMGTPLEVEADGVTYTIAVVGANADTSSVHLQVDDDVKTSTAGQTKTIGGLKVYVEDVFVSNVGGESASAKVFIGSTEYNLGAADGTWNQVQVDNVDLDGVQVNMTDSGSDVISSMYFKIDTTEVANAETAEDYDWLAMGDSFVDPMFGWQFKFVEAIPALDATSRDHVQFKVSGEDLNIQFTNEAGTEYEFTAYQKVSATSNVTFPDVNEAGKKFGLHQNAMVKGATFILEEDATSAEPVSRIFTYERLTNSDADIVFSELGQSGTFTVTSGDAIEDTGVTATVDSASLDTINLSAASKLHFYTMSGLNVSLADETDTLSATALITMTEDHKGQNKDEITGDEFTASVSYDTSDEELNIAKPASWDGGADDSYPGGKMYYGVSQYGTYYVHDSDNNLALDLYVPAEDVDYAVYLAGPDSVVSTSGSGDAMYYNVNPIAVGIAVLDSDAPAVGSDNLIVVGGPCANTVAAELMGNPADCAAGFSDGKGLIKLWEDKNAVLVAGFSAKDTQGAARVLADYASYALTGSEVEVLVPSLASLSVNPVA
jgi:hypothetical protein